MLLISDIIKTIECNKKCGRLAVDDGNVGMVDGGFFVVTGIYGVGWSTDKNTSNRYLSEFITCNRYEYRNFYENIIRKADFILDIQRLTCYICASCTDDNKTTRQLEHTEMKSKVTLHIYEDFHGKTTVTLAEKIEKLRSDTSFRKLTMSSNNLKLNQLAVRLGIPKANVVSFDIPAGFTCPAASICQTYANKRTGKLTMGKNATIECYAAKTERHRSSVRRSHWRNFDTIKGLDTIDMAAVIMASLPKNVKVVRIHSSGDFFSQTYFDAWVMVAHNMPHVTFFGYTKVIQYYHMSRDGQLPENLRLAYSYGGIHDALVKPTDTVSYIVDLHDDKTTVMHNDGTAEYDLYAWVDAIGQFVPVACENSYQTDDYDFIVNQSGPFVLNLH